MPGKNKDNPADRPGNGGHADQVRKIASIPRSEAGNGHATTDAPPAERAKTAAELEWEASRQAAPATPPSWFQRAKTLLLGRARNPFDAQVFHHLSLIAFFAWVGLGADGLSSSCYGPAEAYRVLGQYPHLSIFVALASALTVFVISAGYMQVIEQFPSGGGGYLVASKLLSPTLGMISGCALFLDYVLTIAISIAEGANAVFSFLPQQVPFLWMTLDVQGFKMAAVVAVLGVLTLLNLRGVKESVVPLVPIFLTFVLTHAFVILTTFVLKLRHLPEVVQATVDDVQQASTTLGLGGMLLLMLRAYSMGAGTYTGIEAVSNGLPILREPRAETGKRTMRYMAFSLAVMVLGLMLAYLLFRVEHVPGKTLNAVLFETFTEGWASSGPGGAWGAWAFVGVALASEAAILFIAAQAGFLGGPRILANMAQDRWMPHKFGMLSDRLVTQNGVLLMGGAALATLLLTGGRVDLLLVLYAINVFITFVLSQLGMVRHWWNQRNADQSWRKGMLINGTGLVLCTFILIAVTILKFGDGGWVTLFVTGALVLAVWLIRRHYEHTKKLLKRLDNLVRVAEAAPPVGVEPQQDPNAKTAVLLVNGFNGLGLHTLLNVVRLFPGLFRNFVFVQIGVVDVGTFKGAQEVGRLREHIRDEVQRYVDFARKQGYYAEGFSAVGTDVVDEVANLAPQIQEKFLDVVFFGGQLVFPRENLVQRWLHNNTVFALQRRFYSEGTPVIILPVRVEDPAARR